MGRRITEAHVDSIDTITSQLHRMDDQFGGGAVLDLVKGQVRFVLDLLRDRSYPSTVGKRLHGTAAELLGLAGWTSFDASQHAQAQRFWIAALHAAHSAGDRALGANILGFMSCQAENLDLRADAIRLADAAGQGYPGASPRVSALVNLRAAQAYAGANDRTRCQAAIDKAYEAFRNQTADTTDPDWSYWIDEARVNDRVSHCYARLGDWQKAQAHMATAVRTLEGGQIRDGAVWRVYLATAYAHQGEPEHASETACKAVEILSQEVNSIRGVDHLREVHEALAPYQKLPAVRDFRTQAQELFQTTSGR
jgi:tetratricopeptide (TPR) repeat protein